HPRRLEGKGLLSRDAECLVVFVVGHSVPVPSNEGGWRHQTSSFNACLSYGIRLLPVAASLLWPASDAICSGLTDIAVHFEHGCALHYTLTRLPCKRAGMDKSILAHQVVHFCSGKEGKGRYLFIGIAAELPGLSGLVNLS